MYSLQPPSGNNPTRTTSVLSRRLAGLFLLFCCTCLQPLYADPLVVTVVQSERGGPYDEFTNTLRALLPSTTITLNVQDVSAPLPSPATGLFIALGTRSANELAGNNAAHILNVLIPRSAYKKLLVEHPRNNKAAQFSAIYLDQPVERQLALIASAFPKRHTVGVMFQLPADDEIEQMRLKAQEFRLKLYERGVGSNEQLFEALQDILKHSDVLLAVPAPSLYNSNTLRNLLVSTYQSGVPLVGFSSGYVKAGASCAVFTTPAQFAVQAATAIQRFADTGSLPPAQYAKQFEVEINERVARAMNLNLPDPDDLLKKISQNKGPSQ